METTVEKLEAMFLKSEADLEYIEKRLKLDFINNAAENGCPAEENPALMLENLRAIKAKHTALCSQVKEISAAQKESMASIRSDLSSAMELVQHLQQTADVEVPPLTAPEQEAAELLGTAASGTTTEIGEGLMAQPYHGLLQPTEVPPAVEASGPQQPLRCLVCGCRITKQQSGGIGNMKALPLLAGGVTHPSRGAQRLFDDSQNHPAHSKIRRGCEYEELSEATLATLPPSVRSNIKLADLNAFYQQLQQHLGNNSGSLSVQKMKQLKMKGSDAKLKVLQHLSLVELDRKGHVRLAM
ncbi:SKA complex subunit 2 isoform X1 [Perca flavescens]|uniref:SKA complex subunit 2 isoform X1 n=1 Tax=Perca flavescens TaxID=8167 RepID=UPI00106E20A9|nr:spindle and kinetochore-associated protein 2-like isoform X1 [Perca flavescens]